MPATSASQSTRGASRARKMARRDQRGDPGLNRPLARRLPTARHYCCPPALPAVPVTVVAQVWPRNGHCQGVAVAQLAARQGRARVIQFIEPWLDLHENVATPRPINAYSTPPGPASHQAIQGAQQAVKAGEAVFKIQRSMALRNSMPTQAIPAPGPFPNGSGTFARANNNARNTEKRAWPPRGKDSTSDLPWRNQPGAGGWCRRLRAKDDADAQPRG